MNPRLCTLVLVAACGGGGSSVPTDVLIELDAPVDGLTTHRFVVATMSVPTNNNQAREFALDLDGDGIIENQLGMVMSALSGQGVETQAPVTSAIDRGTILMLPELRADALTQSTLPATFTMFKGANPNPPACADAADTMCRKHLTGSAAFQIAADSPHDPPLSGAIAGGVFTGGPGHLQIVTNMLGPTPIVFDLIGARVKLQMLSTGAIGSGVVAGGVKQTDLDTKIYPQFQMSATAAITRDCPTPASADCGCASGTDGKTFVELFDTTPKNCTVSLDEIKNNTLIQSLFAADLTVEGQAAVSIGIKIIGTGAKYTN